VVDAFAGFGVGFLSLRCGGNEFLDTNHVGGCSSFSSLMNLRATNKRSRQALRFRGGFSLLSQGGTFVFTSNIQPGPDAARLFYWEITRRLDCSSRCNEYYAAMFNIQLGCFISST